MSFGDPVCDINRNDVTVRMKELGMFTGVISLGPLRYVGRNLAPRKSQPSSYARTLSSRTYIYSPFAPHFPSLWSTPESAPSPHNNEGCLVAIVQGWRRDRIGVRYVCRAKYLDFSRSCLQNCGYSRSVRISATLVVFRQQTISSLWRLAPLQPPHGFSPYLVAQLQRLSSSHH